AIIIADDADELALIRIDDLHWRFHLNRLRELETSRWLFRRDAEICAAAKCWSRRLIEDSYTANMTFNCPWRRRRRG
ncbi:hypothetical protein ABTB01_19615, partial [Acinetobacter baumannii]